MNFVEVAMKMLANERAEQVKAGRRELVALSQFAWSNAHHDGKRVYSDTRPSDRSAAGEHAHAPVMSRLRTKKNRAERIAARNLKG